MNLFNKEMFKSGIGRRLVIYMVLFTALVSLISTVVQLLWYYNNNIDLINEELQQVEDVHIESITISMWVLDQPQIKAHLNGVLLLRDIQFVELRDKNKVWLSVGTRQSKNIISRQYPLMYKYNKREVNVGTLYVQANISNIYQRVRDKVWVILVSTGVKIFFIASFMLVLFYMLSTRHLIKISEFVRNINVETTDKKLYLDRRLNRKNQTDEFDLVVNAFNEMQNNIKQSFFELRESEERYRVISRIAPVGIFRTNKSGDNIYVNERWCNLAGMDAEQAFGDGWAQAVHDDDRARISHEWYDAAIKNIPYKSEFRFQHANGKTLWVYCEAEAELDVSGEVLGYVGSVTDITIHKKTEDIWRSLASSTSDLKIDLFMTDVLQRLTDIYDCQYALIAQVLPDTQRAQTLFVWSDGKQIENIEYSLNGTPSENVLDKKTGFAVPKYASKIYSDDEVLVKMGVESYFSAPLISSDGSVLGILSIMDKKEMHIDKWSEPILAVYATRVALEMERDIAVKKLQNHKGQLEKQVELRTRELVTARNEAERANEAKSDFLSNMSHELRTPLNAILGFAQILEIDNSKLSGIQKSNIQEILDAGQHLLELINQVLNLTQIESGKLDINMEKVDLSKLLRDCISLMSTSAEDMNIKIIDNISEYHYFVKADFMRLKQILINLMSNAIKYNNVSGSLLLDASVSNKQKIKICVTDNGDGLTEDQIERLYNPFERINVRENIEGTGIGLTITKHLCELIGAEIGVESTPGTGSTFWVELVLLKNENN